MSGLGVSVYPAIDSMEEIDQYLKKAAEIGAIRVFSGLDFSNVDSLEPHREFIAMAHGYGLRVSLDVTPDSFEKMNAAYDNLAPFHELQVDILRMDISFGGDKDVKLVNNPYDVQIEFNASILTADYIRQLIDKGANPAKMIVCHNYYPQPYTGMRWDKFLRVSREFKELGVQTAAFITSENPTAHDAKRVLRTLPTVDRYRYYPLDLQYRILKAAECIDDILIGNAFPEDRELTLLQQAMSRQEYDDHNPIVSQRLKMGRPREYFERQNKLRVKVVHDIMPIEQEILWEFFPHSDVGDCSEWLWRSRMPRFLYKRSSIPERKRTEEQLPRGTVVIVNDNDPDYRGEVEIVLQPITNDHTRNVIGHIKEEELTVIETISEAAIVIFMPEES